MILPLRRLAEAAGDPGSVSEIHLAGGIYRPDQGAQQTTGDRAASFHLLGDLKMAGGYLGLEAGKGEDPNERDVTANETVLSGDLAHDDAPGFVNRAENSRHVIQAFDVDVTACLDGLVIAGGHSDGKEIDSTGAGLLLWLAKIIVGPPGVGGCHCRQLSTRTVEVWALAAVSAAGRSRRQIETACRPAEIPEEEFEAAVERPLLPLLRLFATPSVTQDT